MKLSDRAKARIRFGLWIASLAWSAYWLVLALIIMPHTVEFLKQIWPGWLPSGILSVTYVFSILTVVVIFLWFFNYLFGKKKN